MYVYIYIYDVHLQHRLIPISTSCAQISQSKNATALVHTALVAAQTNTLTHHDHIYDVCAALSAKSKALALLRRAMSALSTISYQLTGSTHRQTYIYNVETGTPRRRGFAIMFYLNTWWCWWWYHLGNGPYVCVHNFVRLNIIEYIFSRTRHNTCGIDILSKYILDICCTKLRLLALVA